MASKQYNPTHFADSAQGMMPVGAIYQKGPQGALIPNGKQKHDQVAVIYDKGETPPTITVKQISGSVHTILADGIAVAVVARSTGKALCAKDVVLIERGITH